MNNRIVIPLLVAGAVAFACGPRPNTEASTPPVAANAKPATVAPKRHRQPHGARLDPALAVIREQGGVVRVALVAVNSGDKALELTFPDGQTHDVAILDAAGHEVWRWSEGRLFTQSVRTKALGSHDTATFGERWNPEGKHGTFVAVATLHSSNYPVERRAQFVLP